MWSSLPRPSRDEFGTRLASVYAPVVIAGFGSGAARVDVRAIAPDGAAALRSQLAAQHDVPRLGRWSSCCGNKNIQASPAARASLLAGHVDARLLATLSVLAAEMPVRLAAFDGAPPGASPDVPLRGAQIGGTSPAAGSAILAFLHAQQRPVPAGRRGRHRPHLRRPVTWSPCASTRPA